MSERKDWRVWCQKQDALLRRANRAPKYENDFKWSQVPPDRNGQGYWWWWSGDVEAAPSIITVIYSGGSGQCFVSIKDDPNTNDVNSDDWIGWWKRIPDEPVPYI